MTLLKEPQLAPANQRKLNNKIREFIVAQLGAFVSERHVAAQVQEVFGIEISAPGVHYYAVAPGWSTKVKELRTAYRQNLEAHSRLAATEARVMELCRNAEEHQAAAEQWGRKWSEAVAYVEELRERQHRARQGDEDVTPPTEAELDAAIARAKDLDKLASRQEGAWHHALAEIREEMKRGGLEMSFSDADEAAQFIKAMSEKFAQEQAASEGEALPAVEVNDPNAED